MPGVQQKTARPAAARPARQKRPAQSGQGPRDVAKAARESLYREHILRAAERVFADLGFEAAKVQDISRLAGLSMGSIYSLFTGKDQLFSSIIEIRGNELLEVARAVVAAHGEPRAALDALVAAYVDYFFDHPDFLRMHIRTGAAWALHPSAVGSRRALSERFHGLQAEIFARGVASGAFVQEDAAYLAVLFSGIDQAHLAHWVAGGMKGSREELRERLLRVVRRTFLA